jgi:pyridoxamine 5'-phosphate oxidase
MGRSSQDAAPEAPLRLFERWLAQAGTASVSEPEAVAFVTVGQDGRPSARTVLLKRVEDRGARVHLGAVDTQGA